MQPLKKLYFVAGILMVALGAIGVFLPLLPTVPFLLAAAWFFDRSSPRFRNWLYNHPLFGPPLQNWKKNGAISTKTKCLAVISMLVGFLFVIYILKPALWVSISVFVILSFVSIFIITRPSH